MKDISKADYKISKVPPVAAEDTFYRAPVPKMVAPTRSTKKIDQEQKYSSLAACLARQVLLI